VGGEKREKNRGSFIQACSDINRIPGRQLRQQPPISSSRRNNAAFQGRANGNCIVNKGFCRGPAADCLRQCENAKGKFYGIASSPRAIRVIRRCEEQLVAAVARRDAAESTMSKIKSRNLPGMASIIVTRKPIGHRDENLAIVSTSLSVSLTTSSTCICNCIVQLQVCIRYVLSALYRHVRGNANSANTRAQ